MSVGSGPDRRQVLFASAGLGAGLALPRVAAIPEADTARGSVVLFLNGGNDAANTVAPMGRAEFAHYTRMRRHLALPRATLRPLSARDPRDREHGLHPACRELHAAVENGRAHIAWDIAVAEPHADCHHRATAAWHRALGAPPRRDVAIASLADALLRNGRAAHEMDSNLWLDLDGFDLHHDLLRRHDHLWTGIDIALGAWLRQFEQFADAPTLTIASEFGRALEPRGTGADHGWHGHAFAIGASLPRALRGSPS